MLAEMKSLVEAIEDGKGADWMYPKEEPESAEQKEERKEWNVFYLTQIISN